MYNIGDKFQINGSEFTIWMIEDGIYHMVDSRGFGICGDEKYITENAQ